MVVITFSNKAARELQDRLAVLLGPKLASQVIAGDNTNTNPVHTHAALARSSILNLFTFQMQHEHNTLKCHTDCDILLFQVFQVV